jgi:hypothetical protein
VRAVPVANPAAAVANDGFLADAKAALQAKEYEKATAALLAVQRGKALSNQQAQLLEAQMRQLQAEVARGIAAGDPKAKAAMAMLSRDAR